ncbi:hypothetical protein PPYR_08830 [Photinus pyralis]|uniref:Multidrug resistance-associated protein lethal(2)03659 n=1 Tax=Photinus pyralis TaxID=7054 RepID=A0A5N4AKJ3_PHOPY|nr:multidrug resistance-associated protein 4-like [Photinus pyralis]XP_031344027.1 multidrug resistance-associated protein 4-like [Photinus pyralis]XP_031344028.1 multidrug resistance-associated protein 4-like [Photinus pyralis]KAB0797837.1 hypothetical protein PPYR_08830 [Photinus pyralis]
MDLGLSKSEKSNPRQGANIFSILTIWYSIPTFIAGYKKDLEVSDLYKTYTGHQSKLLGDQIEKVWQEELRRKKPSLRRVLFKIYGVSYLLAGLILLTVEVILRLSEPLLLGEVIAHFTTEQTSDSQNVAYGYAGGMVACAVLRSLLSAPYQMAVSHIGMKMRVACCSLIYRKALRLSQTALCGTTIGQMVNLLSNDVNRFDFAALFAQLLWVAPIQLAVAVYFMHSIAGPPAIYGACVSLALVAVQYGVAKLVAKFRCKTALKTDERIRLTNEVIYGIQVIKMYAWEKPLAKFISFVRRNEIRFIRRNLYLRGIMASFFLFSSKLSLFIAILTTVLSGEAITAKKVFVLYAYYDLLRMTIHYSFQVAVMRVVECNVSIKRLHNFLMLGEKSTTDSVSTDSDKKYSIKVDHVVAKWDAAATSSILNNISICIKPKSVNAIIGPVGSGKSSLLQVILKELPFSEGKLAVNGTISYASQEPWIFIGTVRQNIIFNKPFDSDRFSKVIANCSLKRDLALLPDGDMTLVGERGVSLSGGQRARINLARAVYQEADIYLLDDPLSAVDTHVGRQLLDDCIITFLKEKTVVLVTHQLHFLKDFDQIFVLGDGTVKAHGRFDELQESTSDFAKLLNIENETDTEVQRIRTKSESDSNSLLENTNVSLENINKEDQVKGKLSFDVYKSYFNIGTHWLPILCVFCLFFVTQLVYSFSDVFISLWATVEENRYKADPTGFWNFSTETWMYIYIGTITSLVLVTIPRSSSFFIVCMNSSLQLHNQMLSNVLQATMRFFSTTPSGRILNRFSKDMGLVDEMLPVAMLDTLQIFLILVGVIILNATVNVWFLIPAVIMACLFYAMRTFYMATSRSVKRLEGLTRSPVFTHLNASLQGLSTIRAFGAESVLMDEFDTHQDVHSSAWFIFLSTTRAFGYCLDLICALYTTLITFSFFAFENSTNGGDVGLVVTQCLSVIGLLQWGAWQSAEVENHMTSVERILQYNNIEQEGTNRTTEPPDSWPQEGELEFVKLSLHYVPEDPPVLKDLSFIIKAREKIGIVGRTGAGKSSIINALFQLSNTKGSILIDGIDITDIKLWNLRSKISIIPQEPVLFSGTLRKNLDPFNEFLDENLWKALEDVELKHLVKELSLGLNSMVLEGGSNFSIGQRQLICLARAILRNNKLLVLDEATANIDPQTDAHIQNTIREKFAQCTVLTVAHRLNTILDSDKVLVMDAGTIVEFDHPYHLLQNTNGIFHGMVMQTGPAMAQTITNIIKENYHNYNTSHLPEDRRI